MRGHDGLCVCVQSDWKDWRNANVRVDDVRDLYWLQPIGAPRPLLHGWISCSSIVTGEVPHNCDRSSSPHRLSVCILKSHTIPAVYAELARRADGWNPRVESRAFTPVRPCGGHA